MRSRSALAIGLPIAAILVKLFAFAPTTDEPLLYRIVDDVSKSHWVDHLHAQRLAAQRTPIILVNSPASSWPAISRWRRDDYLAGSIPVVDDVVSQEHQIFRYWATEAPLAQWLTEQAGAMLRTPMATAKLLAALRSGRRLYYSRRVEQVAGFPHGDISPTGWLVDRHAEGNSTTVCVA